MPALHYLAFVTNPTHSQNDGALVATLTRRSTDEQHQPFSIELQDTKLAAYTKSQDDWTLVRKYTDNQSGATLDRPGLQRALADARAGLYDLLLGRPAGPHRPRLGADPRRARRRRGRVPLRDRAV